MENDASPEQEWDSVLDALAESVLAATDEELLEEVRADGNDPVQLASQIEDLLLGSARAHFRTERLKLEEAIAMPKLRASERSKIPSSPLERRSLLAYIMQQLPKLGAALATIHHRDYTELTDADVEGVLEQFDELGVLRQLVEPGDGG